MSEITYEVFWEGPFELRALDRELEKNQSHVLYQIYGRHPLYGSNVLLYIGKTVRGIRLRMHEHMDWIEDVEDSCSAYVASIDQFTSWADSFEKERFAKPEDEVIEKVEALLIYHHQPAFNHKSKKSAGSARNVRIFNTGKYGALSAELSGIYNDL